MATLFTKIIQREIPAEIIYEDEICICIRDINPRAPIHVLLIPKKEIISLAHLDEADVELMGYLMAKLNDIATLLGVAEHFKTQIHTGVGGGQEVFHLHIHLLADPNKIPD